MTELAHDIKRMAGALKNGIYDLKANIDQVRKECTEAIESERRKAASAEQSK